MKRKSLTPDQIKNIMGDYLMAMHKVVAVVDTYGLDVERCFTTCVRRRIWKAYDAMWDVYRALEDMLMEAEEK